MTSLPTVPQILGSFGDWKLEPGHRDYMRHHARRWAYLLRLVNGLVDDLRQRAGNRPLKLLDIGPAYQTELLQKLDSNLQVNTVGFNDDRIRYRTGEKHYFFDLNDAQFPEKWLALAPHDLITMCEVIEHLYTSPRLVLRCISQWLAPGGYLVIQTPNACSLQRRIKMMAGLNPFEMIRDQRHNPGHFREYTIKELRQLGREAGLVPVRDEMRNYFDFDSVYYRGYNWCSRFLPPGLRAGITICYQKPAGTG